ncbi:hypothetical protein [Antricoccus suffuscus]|nr:hypothetical protein [Antricoccus suffuscus]
MAEKPRPDDGSADDPRFDERPIDDPFVRGGSGQDPLASGTPDGYAPSNQPPSDWRPATSHDDARITPDDAQPRKSLKDRLLSNKTARFIASAGVPLAMVPGDEKLGRLVEAVSEFGWQISESDDEADAMLGTLPLPIHGYRAGNVVRGRFDPFTNRAADGLPPGEWNFVAFDAVEDSRLGRTVRQCVTAVPTMLSLPDVRVVPSRYRMGPSRGMVAYPTVDPIFDARWKLLAANGEEELRTLSTLIDEDVRDALCSGHDTDELWTHSNHILITTEGPHDENVLARHLLILGAMLRALRTSSMND